MYLVMFQTPTEAGVAVLLFQSCYIDICRDPQVRSADPLVYPFRPFGKETRYIIDRGDLLCAEEVFLHEPNEFFNRSLAF